MSGKVRMLGEAVHTGAKAYDNGVAEMYDVLSKVEGAVDALAATWKGAPYQAYQMLKQQWRADAAKVAEAGSEVSTNMTDSVRAMQNSEDELEGLIKSMIR